MVKKEKIYEKIIDNFFDCFDFNVFRVKSYRFFGLYKLEEQNCEQR